MSAKQANLNQPQSLAVMKARQSAKIAEIVQALIAAGFVTLDDQAKALGSGRSTTWTIMKNNYKNSGLSAATIKHMLSSQELPLLVRSKIIEYVTEKAAGLYGHNPAQRRKFIAMLPDKLIERAHLEEVVSLQPDPEIETFVPIDSE